MKNKIALTLAAVIVSITSLASATDTKSAKVASVRASVDGHGIGVIEIDRDPDNYPTCATYGFSSAHKARWFAVDLESEGGREAMRIATAAFLSGKTVRVTGTGLCQLNDNKEDLAAIYIMN